MTRFISAPYLRFLLLFSNLGIWLGFANNFATFPLAVILWPVCVAAIGFNAKSWPAALGMGWLGMFPGACAALYWLYMPVANVGGLPLPLALLCAFFIAACLSCQSAFFALAAWFVRSSSLWRLGLALVFAWYALEYLFALVLGFPWLQLSGALAAWPWTIQHADIFGAWLGASLWIFPGIIFLRAQSKKYLALAAGICILLSGYAAWRLTENRFELRPAGENVIDALFIEGSVDQNQKWTPAFQTANLELYLDLTRDALATGAFSQPPLIIWPETALPFFYQRMPGLAMRLAEAVRSFGCPLLFGAPGVERLPGKIEDAVFNRAFLLSADGELAGYYDKEHLVPFGEYLPAWLDWPFLEALLQGVGVYTPGTQTSPLHYGPLAMGIMICYEGIFPWIAQERAAAGANILVDISNDGWFGWSPAARQHLYLSVGRCLEQNRWLLRSTNTGISAVTDNRGRLVVTGPMFEAGYLAVSARLQTQSTIYSKISAYLPISCLFLLGILCWPAFQNKRLQNASFK